MCCFDVRGAEVARRGLSVVCCKLAVSLGDLRRKSDLVYLYVFWCCVINARGFLGCWFLIFGGTDWSRLDVIYLPCFLGFCYIFRDCATSRVCRDVCAVRPIVRGDPGATSPGIVSGC